MENKRLIPFAPKNTEANTSKPKPKEDSEIDMSGYRLNVPFSKERRECYEFTGALITTLNLSSSDESLLRKCLDTLIELDECDAFKRGFEAGIQISREYGIK